MQAQNFSKIRSKFLKNIFLKISPHFLVRGCQTLLPDIRIYSTVYNEGGVGFFVSVTNGQTDGRTDLHFFEFPRHTDSNGI